jgi:hypothetical protein
MKCKTMEKGNHVMYMNNEKTAAVTKHGVDVRNLWYGFGLYVVRRFWNDVKFSFYKLFKG